MEAIRRIALALLIIGGLNWGLIGLFQYDLVAGIFAGQDSLMSRIIYSLVGLSAIYCLKLLFESREETNTTAHPRQLNYNTEFGEETNVDDAEDDQRSNK